MHWTSCSEVYSPPHPTLSLALHDCCAGLGYLAGLSMAVVRSLMNKTLLDPNDLYNYHSVATIPSLGKVLVQVVATTQLQAVLEEMDI